MSAAFASYQRFLARRPLLGNVVSSGVLFATGDTIAQQFVEKKGANHDIVRTGRIVAWGGLCFAPVVHQWFKLLELLPFKNKVALAASKVFLDQTVMAPLSVAGFFTFMGYAEGKTGSQIKSKLSSDWFDTLQNGWKVFVPVQAINMSVVPVQLRLLTINMVNIPWNTYLSIQANKGAPPLPTHENKLGPGFA